MPLGPSSINWPASPIVGQTYQSPDQRVWIWTGYAWDAVGLGLIGPTGPTGPTGPPGTGTQTLQQTLVNGNTSGGNDILMSAGDKIQNITTTGGQIELNAASVYANADGGNFLKGWFGADGSNSYLVYGSPESRYRASLNQLLQSVPTAGNTGSNNNRVTINDQQIELTWSVGGTYLSTPGSGNIIIQNTTNEYFEGQASLTSALLLNSGTLANSTKFESGVNRSVALGGEGLTIKTDNTAYSNQLSLQTIGATFDGIVVGTTLSADRTWTFPDLSGTVALQDFTSGTNGSVIFIDGNILSEDPSNFFYDVTNARLGLGTSSPTGKLELYSPENTTSLKNLLRFRDNDTVVGSGDQFIGKIDFYGNENSSPGVKGYIAAAQNPLAEACIVIGTTSGNLGSTASFASGGFQGEAMRIDATGQVGIGISSIDAKLHINNTTSNSTLLIEDTSNPDSTPFLIDSAGQVSIGTTSPKTTIGGVKPKLNISYGDSGVGATGLPIETVMLIENDTTSYCGFIAPNANVSGFYFGTPADTFGMILNWDYNNGVDPIGQLRAASAGGRLGFGVGNKTNPSITIEPGAYTGTGDRRAETTIYGDMYLPQPDVPSTATSTGTTGQISWDSDYIYVCVGTNTWKRTTIATW